MPSLNFIFRDLDMAAMHLSAIVGTLTGSGLHRIVYYSMKFKDHGVLFFPIFPANFSILESFS
jgi:hypothetical protein